MKGNNDLFDLVKSLTKSEKRHFSMYCTLQRGEKYYLRLFEEMNLADSYDEQQLKEKLKGHAVVKHWAVSKKYLYDKILEAAQQTKVSHDPDSEVGNFLEAYKFLRGKGLTNQAMRFLRKAKKKAKDNDLFTRLYNVLNQEYFDTLLFFP